jgi:hypothetical protein
MENWKKICKSSDKRSEKALRSEPEVLSRMSRLDAIDRFYEILRELDDRLGGCRQLFECDDKMGWPKRGVYFFFENGEERTNGRELRVVRVGTHALKQDSHTTLWDRLRTHRGFLKGRHAGGGNHRGSVFRLHVGTAVIRKKGLEKSYPAWGEGSSAPKRVRDTEYPIEKMVSQHIRSMPFLWLEVNDPPGPQSERAYIESNSIILLSNYRRLRTVLAVDPPSSGWLGHFCRSDIVRESGLWNVNHVTEELINPNFLDKLELRVRSVHI